MTSISFGMMYIENFQELYANILPDYYGWRDEDNVDMLLEEAAAEAQIEKEDIAKKPAHIQYMDNLLDAMSGNKTSSAADPDQPKRRKNVALVHTPTDDEIQHMLLEKKRELALQKNRDAQICHKGRPRKNGASKVNGRGCGVELLLSEQIC